MRSFGLSGFSLIEILVSMVLLVAVSGLAFSAFSSSAKAVNSSPNNTAVNLARGLTEMLHDAVLGNQYNAANGNYSAGNLLQTPAAQPGASLNGVNYARSYTSDGIDVNGDGVPDYKRVRANVTW